MSPEGLTVSESARRSSRVSLAIVRAPIVGKNIVHNSATEIVSKRILMPSQNEFIERRRVSFCPFAPACDVCAAAAWWRTLSNFNAASALTTAIKAWHASKRLHEVEVRRRSEETCHLALSSPLLGTPEATSYFALYSSGRRPLRSSRELATFYPP